jgi:hypothetical protein
MLDQERNNIGSNNFKKMKKMHAKAAIIFVIQRKPSPLVSHHRQFHETTCSASQASKRCDQM